VSLSPRVCGYCLQEIKGSHRKLNPSFLLACPNCARRGKRYFKLLYIYFFGSSDGIIIEKQPFSLTENITQARFGIQNIATSQEI
jgi:hypothetical protein